MIEMTSKDIDTTIKGVEQEMSLVRETSYYHSETYVSVNSNWVHPPGQPPGISSKTLAGGSGFDF